MNSQNNNLQCLRQLHSRNNEHIKIVSQKRLMTEKRQQMQWAIVGLHHYHLQISLKTFASNAINREAHEGQCAIRVGSLIQIQIPIKRL